MYQTRQITVEAQQFTDDPTAITLVELNRLHESNIYVFYDEHIEELVSVLPYDWIVIKFKGTEDEIVEVMSNVSFQRQFENGPN